MVTVIGLKKEHVKELLLLPKNNWLKSVANDEAIENMENSNKYYTILCSKTNRVLMCGGIVDHWPGRGEGWMIFNDDVEKFGLAIWRCILRLIRANEHERLEAYLIPGLERWGELLESVGFEREGFLRKYQPDGSDSILYALVR